MNLNHKLNFVVMKQMIIFGDYTCKNIDHTSGEDPESAEATNKIYSLIITGSDEIKSLKLIPSWILERFEEIITCMDME